ncbi:MAG: BirA family biotin operon repressor/biotin-[acetyl-CoA-carboxylase] ligase [Flavobacteriales bacterium]
MTKYTIEFLNEVESTNTYLKEKVRKQGLVSPYCVTAAVQSHGKGQREKVWESKPYDNILASFLVNKPGSFNDLSKLNYVAALAVVDCLQNAGIAHVAIKWPNDVYVADKKIAGILIENSLTAQEVKNAVVGIGLNVNQVQFASFNATSMALETAKTWDATQVLHQLYDTFYYYLKQDLSKLLLSVNELLFKKNEPVTFEQDGRMMEYKIKAVLANGNLAVLLNENQIELEHHKVKWIL